VRRPRSMLSARARAICSVAAALTAGCTDFGYAARPPPIVDSGGVGPALDGCVEGPSEPTVMGPQIGFLTLSVDTPNLTIGAGDVVTWTNASSQNHTASAGGPGADVPPEMGGFDSGLMAAGGSQWAWQFCIPRTVEWYCKTHPAMMNGYLITIEL